MLKIHEKEFLNLTEFSGIDRIQIFEIFLFTFKRIRLQKLLLACRLFIESAVCLFIYCIIEPKFPDFSISRVVRKTG